MIVYFLTKSKAGRGLLLGLGLVLAGYAQFVFIGGVSGHPQTLHIVKGNVSETVFQPIGVGETSAPQHPFVASKRGTYYYPSSCSRARTLSVKNMLYFKDISAAEAAGYKPYSGC
jgi:hypothetical protein